jgi:hypothetical protein
VSVFLKRYSKLHVEIDKADWSDFLEKEEATMKGDPTRMRKEDPGHTSSIKEMKQG